MNALVEKLERAVADEFAAQRGSYPNPPGVDEYRRHAEALGMTAQTVCESSESTGGYYDVLALYEPGMSIFGREPLALVFEDFSKAMSAAWLLVPA